jgi:hypothetical protein
VSHGSHDIWIARQMARCIGECGAEPFLDANDIQTGDEFKRVILAELRRADELVVLFTPFSRNSVWLWSEIAVTAFLEKRVIGIFYGMALNDLRENGGTGFPEERHVRQLNDFDSYLGELRGRIEHVG